MAEIKVLSQQLSNMIAAGEVVERPASAVKELVENSIDADAKSIIVEIKNGGITYIRVTDNGKGMHPDDAKTAFLRHATSKISREEDLENICTLGFRGEALASIAAVSRTELLTKQKGQIEGTHVEIEGGNILSSKSAGCPEGTTIVVRNLFFNTPARMKFLKKDSTEAGYIGDILQKIALAKPEVSFRFINNGKEVFYTSGDGNLHHAIYAIYGKEYASNMVEVNYENEGAKVYGYIGRSNLSRPNRNFQTFFVNGRCVVNKTIAFALSESYKNQIMVGKFPVAVLNIMVNPKAVDVNVHPAKTEVKFYQERTIYDVVYWGCKNALFQNVTVPEAEIPKKGKEIFRFPVHEEKTVQETISVKTSEPIYNFAEKKEEGKEPIPAYVPKEEPIHKAPRILAVAEEFVKETHPLKEPVLEEKVSDEKPKESLPKEEKAFRIVGQAFSTYILIEMEKELWFIDQHAAHERLNFESLKEKRANNQIQSQILMVPITLELSAVEYDTYMQNKGFFEGLGFEIEEFGTNSLVVRMIPMDISHDEIPSLIVELLEQISSNRREVIGQREERAMYTIACKAAIKANHNLKEKEIEDLVRSVLDLEGINTCPHGRPICIKMTQYNIEKEFKRIQN